ncbi:MAG: hypothetical protein K8F91_04960 [Candidatus Obscuribacterales bacterium]|nr:hypothetical protein [Candidatus Obscuribacterales bacterium]
MRIPGNIQAAKLIGIAAVTATTLLALQATGLVVCLKTGDADGWTAWGGNAQHNKQN